ncbi:hypothetical protein RRG08_027373 [Elysia crispata]|uniref:Uncharacterized protein n=1 Tax=Elysia crispata TaxID=231223 RepID=A0AAE1D0N6_9GAST|nr:hypothetical protein RRG08_027373 [Elysia crispata]
MRIYPASSSYLHRKLVHTENISNANRPRPRQQSRSNCAANYTNRHACIAIFKLYKTRQQLAHCREPGLQQCLKPKLQHWAWSLDYSTVEPELQHSGVWTSAQCLKHGLQSSAWSLDYSTGPGF